MAAAVIRALLLLSAAGSAVAAGPALRDPTLPPARVVPTADATPAEAPTPLRLLMIVRTGEARRALIGGPATVSVAAGDEFDTGRGRARVLRVTDSSVHLAHGSGQRVHSHERLDLHPELRSPSTPRSGR